LKYSILTMAFMAAMSGCIDSGSDDTTDAGSGGGGDGGGPATVERISFSGLVADGYLDSATVCLDINENKVCDAGEPSTTSGAGGAFTIADATQEQRDTYPLLVQVVVGTTIDEDTKTTANPDGVVLNKPLTLSAPVGYEFISPLSTMVQSEVEDGSTPSQAEMAVQEKLGTTLSLDEDYIAAQESGEFTAEQEAEFAQLHQVAQVTARVISDNIVKLEDAAEENSISIDDLISAIVDEVFDALEEITIQVEEIAADPETEFNPDTVAQAVDEEVVDLEPDTIVDVVDQNNAEEAATEANLATVMLGDGLAWLWSGEDNGALEAEYGIIKTNGTGDFIDEPFTWNGTAFIADTTSDPDSGHVFNTSTGWISIANLDEPSSVVTNADGSIELLRGTGDAAFSERLKGEEVDLSTLNMRTNIEGIDDGDGWWARYVAADDVFTTGAKGYILSDNGSDMPYIIPKWTDCDAQDLHGGSCNVANFRNLNDFGTAATLSEVFTTTAVTLSGDFNTDAEALKTLEIGYNDNGPQLQIEIFANGTLNYLLVDYSIPSIVSLGASTWSTVTATTGGDKAYILVPIEALPEFDELDLVLAEVDGFVRRGFKGNSEERSVEISLLNKAAVDQVVANFALDNLDLKYTEDCTTGNSAWDGQQATISTQWNSITEFNTAVTTCLSELASSEVPYTEEELKDGTARNLANGALTTYLANNMGVITGDNGQLWFDWHVNGDSRLVLSYANATGVPETITVAQLIRNLDQAYVQSKSFLENSEVTATFVAGGMESHGLIGANAFELAPLNGVAPTILFDSETLAGTYEARSVNDGGGDFIFNANGTGSVHWLPDAEQLAQDPQHQGDDDTLTWIADAQGRLVVTLINDQGAFSGVDRYSLTTGTQDSGAISAQAINSNGLYQHLGDFTWSKTGEAPKVACTAGDVDWNQTTDPSGSTLKVRAEYDAAVAGCLGVNAFIPFTLANLVDTSFIASDGSGNPEYTYSFNGHNPTENAPIGTVITPDGTFNFSWSIEQMQDVDPQAVDGEDITGVLKLNYAGTQFEQVTMVAYDVTSDTASLKGRTQFESEFPGADKGDIWSNLFVKTSPASTTLADLVAVGVVDESRDDGTRNTYWDFVDNGNNVGVFKVYEREDPAACYDLTEIPITDNGSGSFSLDDSATGGPSDFPVAWHVAADGRIYDDNDSFPPAADQNVIAGLTMCQ